MADGMYSPSSSFVGFVVFCSIFLLFLLGSRGSAREMRRVGRMLLVRCLIHGPKFID
jgi:hypothetical protein